MNIFKKKETIIENITFMAIISAINIVLSVVATLLGGLLPVVSVFFIIILPLSSTVVMLYCKNIYYPIYAIATLGLSLVATMWNMQYTIFYLFPSLITGCVFGLFIKKKIPGVYSILIASILQTGITYALIPLLNVIYSTNFIEAAKTLFDIKTNSLGEILIPSIIFFVSLVQIILSYFVVSEEVKKLKVNNVTIIKKNWLLPLISLILLLIAIPLYFIYLKGLYVLILIALYLTIYSIIVIIQKNIKATLIGTVTGLILFIICFAIFYTMIPEPNGFVLIALLPFFNNIAMIMVSLLIKK